MATPIMLPVLPEEVLREHLFDKFSPETLGLVRRVSRLWCKIATTSSLWEKFCSILSPVKEKDGSTNWYRTFVLYRSVPKLFQSITPVKNRVEVKIGGTVAKVALSKNNVLACSFSDFGITTHNLVNDQTATCPAHTQEIISLTFFDTGDNEYLVSSSSDKTVKIWDPENLGLVYNIDFEQPVTQLAATRDSLWMVENQKQVVKCHRAAGSWQTENTFKASRGNIFHLAAYKNGVAFSGVRAVFYGRGDRKFAQIFIHSKPILDLALSSLYVLISDQLGVHLWERKSKVFVHSLPNVQPLFSTAMLGRFCLVHSQREYAVWGIAWEQVQLFDLSSLETVASTTLFAFGSQEYFFNGRMVVSRDTSSSQLSVVDLMHLKPPKSKKEKLKSFFRKRA